MKFGRMTRSVVVGAIVAGFGVGAIGVAGASTPAAAKEKSLPAAQLNIVAYSTPTAAFASLISAFQATTAGKNITFTQSFGASGDQTRAIIAGQKADIVDLSLQPDMQKLVDAGIVAPTWNQNKYKGFVTDSVAVIATRSGNPKKLKDWTDLTKSGVETITPNPFTSGAAKWNILSAYGAQSNLGKNEQAGLDYLTKLFKQVPVQDTSGRAALTTFTSGKGDALITYENEAILAKNAGQPVDYTIPTKTMLIQNPIAVTKNTQEPQAGQGVPRLPLLEAGRADLGRERLPPGERPDPVGEAVQDPDGPVHHRRPRRLADHRQGVLRPDGRQVHGDREEPRGGDIQVAVRGAAAHRRCLTA